MNTYTQLELNRGSTNGGGGTPDGVVYVPTVSENGDISWTNNGGLPNPQAVNIKGPEGNDGNTYIPEVEDVHVINSQTEAEVLIRNDPQTLKSYFTFGIPRSRAYTPVMGNITTAPSNVDASATLRLNNEQMLAFWDFALPKGEKGEPGKGAYTIVQDMLYANGWTEEGEYLFQNTYPKEVYRMQIELDGDRANAQQYSLYGAAKIVGSYTENKCKALGTVPAFNLPIVVTLEQIGDWSDVTPESIEIVNAPDYALIEGNTFNVDTVHVMVTMESGRIVDVTDDVTWTPALGTVLTSDMNNIAVHYETAAGSINATIGIIVKPRSEVGWQGGTDSDVKALLKAHEEYGTNIDDYFQIGDIREVTLTNGYTAHLVLIQNYATAYYDEDTLEAAGTSTFLVGMKEAFANASNYYVTIRDTATTNTKVEMQVPDDDGTLIPFYDLLPNTLKGAFKLRQMHYYYNTGNNDYKSIYQCFSYPPCDIANGSRSTIDHSYEGRTSTETPYDGDFTCKCTTNLGGYYDTETQNSNRVYKNIYANADAPSTIYAHGYIRYVNGSNAFIPEKYMIYNVGNRRYGPNGSDAGASASTMTLVGVI